MNYHSENERASYLSREIASGEPHGAKAFFFPINAEIELPPAEQGADILAEVIADDTHHYYVKGRSAGIWVPASELIVALLSELINLPVPTPKIVRMRDRSLVFGSRKIASISDKVETAAILTSMTLPPSGFPIAGLRRVLAEAYAFDLFINNNDRHEGNYYCCKQDGHYRLYLIDHARSLIARGIDAFPPVKGYGTIFTGRGIRERHGFDLDAALALVERLEALAPESIARITDAVPDEWLPSSEKEQFISWWANGGRRRKIQRLRGGLLDGSLL